MGDGDGGMKEWKREDAERRADSVRGNYDEKEAGECYGRYVYVGKHSWITTL